ncbi:hypothetical protein GCM10011529_05640 [Polymorphobacter glacialis]|uniref:Uncharacterized protein n=1 Tax=Sandarakinorhabdus glacialis TaxID=1614636 RepID=A0A916ZLK5_9SPHN|nr:hypothetical protein [Polymorphobacter glacialis]GGE02102.1 hypothetical protein GCM10011529_05640 [Polymorphobacter glacialis]
MKLSDDKFLSFHGEVLTQKAFCEMAYQGAALHPRSSTKFEAKNSTTGSDQFVYFRTNLNTFIFWAHHGVDSDSTAWFHHHPMAKAMAKGRDDLLSGTYQAPTMEEILAVRSPDWREQIKAIRKRT